MGEVLRQALGPQKRHAGPNHILNQGEADSTHLAFTDRGREVVDTLTVMQLFFISHNMGKDSTSLDCKDPLLKASISSCLGRMKGQNITGDLVATELKIMTIGGLIYRLAMG